MNKAGAYFRTVPLSRVRAPGSGGGRHFGLSFWEVRRRRSLLAECAERCHLGLRGAHHLHHHGKAFVVLLPLPRAPPPLPSRLIGPVPASQVNVMVLARVVAIAISAAKRRSIMLALKSSPAAQTFEQTR